VNFFFRAIPHLNDTKKTAIDALKGSLRPCNSDGGGGGSSRKKRRRKWRRGSSVTERADRRARISGQ
jgi:hypothetical protein